MIDKLRAEIPAPILGHYDRLMDRGKKGVAVVRKGVCSECHMRLATGVLATLMQGNDIQLCGNCGRYLLYRAEAVETAAAAVPVASEPAAPKKRKRKAPVHVH